ncbi:alkaline phosphatase family protein [Haloplanus ruber]|uniref:Alkaline phosphatase family protein n=1 Tax=Haloplanus ruber TaxID=869892 RepID=A0ABD6CXD0_9EURY|nr:alkaline phosphatase family protein [Haloplanus ruber]
MRRVALIVLDCVRKDYFDENATQIKKMADLDVDECYAASSWSVPSHSSLFTGTLPHEHQVHSYNTDYSILKTFFEEVESEGISANGAVSDAFNADKLFNEFVAFSGKQEITPDAVTFKDVVEYEAGLQRIVEYLRQAIDDGKLKHSLINGIGIKANHFIKRLPIYPFGDHGASQVTKRLSDSDADFVFCNYIDAHAPMQNHRYIESNFPKGWHSNQISIEDIRDSELEASQRDLNKYHNLYSKTIQYLDSKIATFAEEMPDDMTLIITADHGEEMLMDGESDLGHTGFSQSLLHVPFVIIGSDAKYDGGTVSHLDVPAMVEQLWESRELTVPTREFVLSERPGMMFYDGDNPWWNRAIRAVTVNGIRWQWDDLGNSHKVELTKSKEEKKVEAKIPAEYKDMFDGTVDELGDDSQNIEVSNQVETRLKELGYKI